MCVQTKKRIQNETEDSYSFMYQEMVLKLVKRTYTDRRGWGSFVWTSLLRERRVLLLVKLFSCRQIIFNFTHASMMKVFANVIIWLQDRQRYLYLWLNGLSWRGWKVNFHRIIILYCTVYHVPKWSRWNVDVQVLLFFGYDVMKKTYYLGMKPSLRRWIHED